MSSVVRLSCSVLSRSPWLHCRGFSTTLAPLPCETMPSQGFWLGSFSWHVCDLWSHTASYPQPPLRRGHGCTVGIDRDPPVWPSTQAGWWRYQSASSYVRAYGLCVLRARGRVCGHWFYGRSAVDSRKKKKKGQKKKKKKKQKKKGKNKRQKKRQKKKAKKKAKKEKKKKKAKKQGKKRQKKIDISVHLVLV